MTIELRKTCSACPEQYDAYDENGTQVGYLRLRHGMFRVDCPDVGGETVFRASPNGDGIFEEAEREFYLTEAKTAIQGWMERRDNA